MAARAMVEAHEATAAADGDTGTEPGEWAEDADFPVIFAGAGAGVQPPVSTIVDACIVQPVLQRTRLVGEVCALYLRHECRLQEALSTFRLFFLGAVLRFEPESFVRHSQHKVSRSFGFCRRELTVLRAARRSATHGLARRPTPC